MSPKRHSTKRQGVDRVRLDPGEWGRSTPRQVAEMQDRFQVCRK